MGTIRAHLVARTLSRARPRTCHAIQHPRQVFFLALEDSGVIDNRDILMAAAPWFRLDTAQATAIWVEVVQAVADWRAVARALGMRGTDLLDLEPAFAQIRPWASHTSPRAKAQRSRTPGVAIQAPWRR